MLTQCDEPNNVFGDSVIHTCSNTTWELPHKTQCFIACEPDQRSFSSRNPHRFRPRQTGVKIECSCPLNPTRMVAGEECRWRFKNDPLKCFPCTKESNKFRPSYFSVYRNYNLGGSSFLLGKENAILVNVKVSAIKNMETWSLAVIFKEPVREGISIFGSEYSAQWNCQRDCYKSFCIKLYKNRALDPFFYSFLFIRLWLDNTK